MARSPSASQPPTLDACTEFTLPPADPIQAGILELIENNPPRDTPVPDTLGPIDMDGLRSVGSSEHNPANQMDVEPLPLTVRAITAHPFVNEELGEVRDFSEGPPELVVAAFGGTLSPEFAALITTVQGMLQPLHNKISMISARLDKREYGPPHANVTPWPKPPTLTGTQHAPLTRQVITQPVAPTPSRAPAKLPPPPSVEATDDTRGRGWNRMAATGVNITDKSVRQHARVVQFASATASAQGHTPAGNPHQGANPPAASQTEATVIRYGGFDDRTREAALHARSPQSIVLDVRLTLEKNMRDPIKVLGGRWSTVVEKTGNFVFVLAGDISEDAIRATSTYLCGPFPDAVVIPNAGWVWVQLRGVDTTDAAGILWEQEDLLAGTRTNPAFEHATMCIIPHWQVPPHKLLSATSTVRFAFCDVSGKIVKWALAKGVYMFGKRAKFVVVGDHPTVLQCGRCHKLGHHTNSPVCHIPKMAARCFLCGG